MQLQAAGTVVRGKEPAQWVALIFGLWWISNGIAVFAGGDVSTFDPAGAQGALGITANGWHGLYHLLPGLLGVAVYRSAPAARAYCLAIGAFYLLGGIWGAVDGAQAFGVVAVDTIGDVVHTAEGVVTLAAGLMSAGTRPVALQSARQ